MIGLLDGGLWYLTFNNISVISVISVISWRSVLLAEETRVPTENHRPVASHWQTTSHNVVSSTPRLGLIRAHNVVLIGTDCIGSYKCNYHTITTTMDPGLLVSNDNHPHIHEHTGIFPLCIT